MPLAENLEGRGTRFIRNDDEARRTFERKTAKKRDATANAIKKKQLTLIARRIRGIRAKVFQTRN